MTKTPTREELLDAIFGTRSAKATLGKASLFKEFPEDRIRSELETKLKDIDIRYQAEIEELRANNRSLKNVRINYARRAKNVQIKVRSMTISLLKCKFPRSSQRELCAKLDARTDGNPAMGPLSSWHKRTWVDAYDDPKTRPKLKVYLSKIKSL